MADKERTVPTKGSLKSVPPMSEGRPQVLPVYEEKSMDYSKRPEKKAHSISPSSSDTAGVAAKLPPRAMMGKIARVIERSLA